MMNRFLGGSLPPNPRIALVTMDNLGNFVIGTPMMQMLKAQHGGTLDYYGGSRVMELASTSDLVDFAYPLHGANVRESAALLTTKSYDLVINVEWTTWAKAATSILALSGAMVCGPCLAEDGRKDLAFPDDERGNLWRDQEWISPEIRNKYPFLKSTYIAEIFCRLAYLEGEIPRYRLPMVTPNRELPDVWVSASASLPDKLWPLDKWLQVLNFLHSQGKRVGLLGAKPSTQSQFWKGGSDEDKLVEAGVLDFRGEFTLPEVVGAISRSKLVFTLDNGILHLSCGTNTPIIGLFREGIHRLWAPPNPHLTVLCPRPEEYVSEIGVDQVIESIQSLNI